MAEESAKIPGSSALVRRQAVVIIHGIGEQRPMETLRRFVQGVKSVLNAQGEAEQRSTIRSKPDSIGNIYETTRLSMDSAINKNGSVKRPKTDFYEFYWAHNMRSTRFSNLFTWMNRLIFTWVGKVPERLKPVWYTVWGSAVLLVGIALGASFWLDIPGQYKALPPLVTAAAFPFLFSLLSSFGKRFFLNFAGDAARYFTPTPDNISERSAIRQQGIAFLKKLHQIRTVEKADRIIVVAHSLGAVVGYDLLRLLWTEYNEIYAKDAVPKQPAIREIDRYYDENSPLPAGKEPAFYERLVKLSDTNLQEYRDLQGKCWQEQREMKNPWLVTDFITVGAAVHAADYFMVTTETVNNLIEQRELPVCPPAKDRKDYSIHYKSSPSFKVGNKPYKAILLNHGALFAVTRWTNIYFSCDYVGGPMQRIFGRGIKDIEVRRSCPWFIPGGHTQYWNVKDRQNALREIVEAMKLDLG
jgi:pimeloyl-ACP methyl ester carboxylesterase